MTQHFGTTLNLGFVIEEPDPARAGQTRRPAPGSQVPVQSAPDQQSLPPLTTGDYGTWAYEVDDDTIDAINVWGALPNGTLGWIGPLYSREAQEAGNNAGANASAALAGVSNLTPQVSTAVADSAYARSRADYAVSQIGSGGGSFTGSVSWSSQVTDKPVIAPQSAITTPVSQSGTTYPTPAAAYGRWWFTGTADPTVQGIAPRNGDRWTKVKLA